jgi:hypothetical protein
VTTSARAAAYLSATGRTVFENDEHEGCCGRDERHKGDPIRCSVWSLAGCDYCGVQQR